MNCNDAAEFASALCDGQTIPPDAATHILECAACGNRLNEYAVIGVQLRLAASASRHKEALERSRETKSNQPPSLWQKGWESMRIPRLAFGMMAAAIVILSGSLFLVRARTNAPQSALILTFKLPGSNNARFCTIDTSERSIANHCGGGYDSSSNSIAIDFRMVSREGRRTQIAVKARTYVPQPGGRTNHDEILKNAGEVNVWIESGEKRIVTVSGVGEIELSGEYVDHRPTLLFRPEESLDPKSTEFRFLSPVLVRNDKVLANFAGSSSIDTGDADATLMMYLPGEGRFLISVVPFEGAVQGEVTPGQIGFNLAGNKYLLLTAMPTTLAEHVWVAHDAGYKLSEHMKGAADNQGMFMVRKLGDLQSPQIHH